MFTARGLLLDSFKEHYHRINIPRRVALQRHRERLATQPAKQAYSYNRWWVNNDHEFVHQHAYVEDPAVIQRRREEQPEPTSEDLWASRHSPNFLRFQPFINVVDYTKDADVKSLKPINIPRWKDYMYRRSPHHPADMVLTRPMHAV